MGGNRKLLPKLLGSLFSHRNPQEEGFEEFAALLEQTGHNDDDGPRTTGSCISVLDTTVAAWTPSELAEMHRNHDIHIIPSAPQDVGFSEDGCAELGIDVDQIRDVHGMLSLVFCCRWVLNFFFFSLLECRQRNGDDYDTGMRAGRLRSLLQSNPEDPGRQNVNFLSISLPHGGPPLPEYIRSVSPVSFGCRLC